MSKKIDLSLQNLLPTPIWQRIINWDDPVIFDVGANDGGTSAVFLNLFPRSKVYAFEPDPRAIQRFRMRFLSGQIHEDRCKLIDRAVSNVPAVMPFYQSSGENPEMKWYDTGWDLSGSLKRPLESSMPGFQTIKFENSINVFTTTLDLWAEENQIAGADLLWIDTQGAELDVLSGAKKLLESTALIYLECSEVAVYEGQATYSELVNKLSNFALIQRYPNDLLFANRNFINFDELGE